MEEGIRKRTLLIALGGLALAMGWHLFRPIPGVDPQLAISGHLPLAIPAPPAARRDKVERLRLASLDAPISRSMTGRDPWRFGEPLLHSLIKEPHPVSVLAAQRSPSPPPQTKVKLPQLSLDYLGNFGPSDQRIAVFTDGKRTINARVGEILDGNFLLTRIGYESVELRFVGFPDQPARRLGIHRRSGAGVRPAAPDKEPR